MEPWLPLIAFGLGIGGLMLVVTRYQTRRYQSYLDRHISEAAKLVAALAQSLAATERQAAALERIANVLEQRKS